MRKIPTLVMSLSSLSIFSLAGFLKNNLSGISLKFPYELTSHEILFFSKIVLRMSDDGTFFALSKNR
jgi:hypothetical protein